MLLFYNVHQPNVELYERARSRDLSVRMLRCEGRADLSAIRQIQEYIQEEQVDLIHTHGYKADLYGYLAARTEAKPMVATCHNWVGGTAALGIYNRLDRMALKRFQWRCRSFRNSKASNWFNQAFPRKQHQDYRKRN